MNSFNTCEKSGMGKGFSTAEEDLDQLKFELREYFDAKYVSYITGISMEHVCKTAPYRRNIKTDLSWFVSRENRRIFTREGDLYRMILLENRFRNRKRGPGRVFLQGVKHFIQDDGGIFDLFKNTPSETFYSDGIKSKPFNKALKLLEDVGWTVYLLSQARDKIDCVNALLNFAKLCSEGSVLLSFHEKWSEALNYLLDDEYDPGTPVPDEVVLKNEERLAALLENDQEMKVELQAGEIMDALRNINYEELWKTCSDILQGVANIQNSVIYRKLYKFFMYAISLNLLGMVGLSLDKFRFSKLAREAIRKEYHFGLDFVQVMIKTLKFLCEQGYQCYLTGSLSPLYHCGDTYSEWVDDVEWLKIKSKFSTNFEAVGTTRTKYLSRLYKALEVGAALQKQARLERAPECRAIDSYNATLQLLKDEAHARADVMRTRKTPLGLVIYGGTSIMKSSLIDLLHFHYCKTRKIRGVPAPLPLDDHFRYTRNPFDDYVSGFTTDVITYVSDDAGSLKVDACGPDKSILELLQVCNNVAWCVTMPGVDDKGKTPMRCELMMVTTNNPALNIPAMFECPAAVFRRFPIYLDVRLKPEFALNDGTVDFSKIQRELPDGEFPNYWEISVKAPVIISSNRTDGRSGATARFEVQHVFTDIYLFLRWFSQRADEHRERQDTYMDCKEAVRAVQICSECYLPTNRCICSNDQCCQICGEFWCICGMERCEDCNQLFGENRTCACGTSWQALPVSGSPVPVLYREEIVEESMQRIISNAVELRTKSQPWWRRWFKLKSTFIWLQVFFFLTMFKLRHYRIVGGFARKVFGTYWFQTFLWWCCWQEEVRRACLVMLGERIERRLGSHPWLKFVSVIVGTTAFAAAVYSLFTRWRSCDRRGAAVGDSIFTQGNISSSNARDELEAVGTTPTQGEISNNPWYNENPVLTIMDVGRTTLSWKTMDADELHERLFRNIALLKHRYVSTPGKVQAVSILCLGEQLWVANSHALPKEPDVLDLEIYQSPALPGVVPNCSTKVCQNDIKHYDDRSDLAFIRIRSIPPKSKILDLLARKSTDGVFSGVYLGRDILGAPCVCPVFNIRASGDQVFPTDRDTLLTDNTWTCSSNIANKIGDCGRVLVGNSPRGPIILGIHCAGNFSDFNIALRLDYETVQPIYNSNTLGFQACELALSTVDKCVKLTALHPRETIRWIPEGTASVFGSVELARSHMRSSVCDSMVRLRMESFGFNTEKCAPNLRSWAPKARALMDMVMCSNHLDCSVFDSIESGYRDDIRAGINTDDLEGLGPVPISVAINGVAGMRFFDPIDRNTSAGFPYNCSKKRFALAAGTRELPEAITFTDPIISGVHELMRACCLGILCWMPFNACLKDEPISRKKAKIGKVRVFSSCPLIFSLLFRMVFMTMMALMQYKPFAFEHAIGIDCHSIQFQHLYDYLVWFGEDQIIAGDYTAFDKHMSPEIICCAFRIWFYLMIESKKYEPPLMKCAYACMFIICFPLTCFFGCIIMFWGTNPSGQNATVLINSMVNSLFMRYAYLKLNPKKECQSFQKFVHLITYGDDNVMGVSKEIPWFNHCAIQEILGKAGIIYTMADKDAESVPYIHINQATFLKRHFRYDADIGCVVGPLVEQSIIDSLMVITASKSICKEFQMVQIMEAALMNWFLHGKEVFHARRQMILSMVEEFELEVYVIKSSFRTWEGYKAHFWAKKGVGEFSRPFSESVRGRRNLSVPVHSHEQNQ